MDDTCISVPIGTIKRPMDAGKCFSLTRTRIVVPPLRLEPCPVMVAPVAKVYHFWALFFVVINCARKLAGPYCSDVNLIQGAGLGA